MGELEIIEQKLVSTARRRRWHGVWQGFWKGFLAGAVLWLLALAVFKLFPVPVRTLLVAAGAALLAVGVGALMGGWRRLSLLQTARWVDERHHYQERLSTALEVSGDQTTGRWRDLILADAASRARELEPRRLFPLVLPRVARWVAVVLAVAAGLGFVPEYRSKAHQQRQKDVEVMKEAGRQLTELARRQLENRPPALETTQKALESVQELGQLLAKAQLTRTEALKELASATDRVRQEMKELGRNPALRKLDQGMRTAPGAATVSSEAMQRKLEELQQELGKQAAKAESLLDLKKDMEKIQAAAAAAMNPSDASAAAAMKSQLSEMMSDLAKKAEELGLELPGIEEAMKALADGKIDKLLKDLDLASLDLEKLAQMAKAMKDLKAQMAEVGKNLAEQLEKGQGMPALATLQKMIRQLKEGNLSDQQLRDLMAEVDQAVKPGSEYGQLGEFLKNAVKQMQRGQKPDAAQSLAQAADELKRLMEQAGDCESMMAALNGLRTGQMCLGNGMCWGACLGSRGMGMRPGGKPGRGVGTWGDDSLEMTPEDSGLWDNSGFQRPDMDPRGLTDRGEGQLNAGLMPTQVKGKISPGGQMPSIPLRGVSIKGQSKVDFEERVTAAQSEAQGALNQDQVPRAYRGAVKDYFDDLK